MRHRYRIALIGLLAGCGVQQQPAAPSVGAATATPPAGAEVTAAAYPGLREPTPTAPPAYPTLRPVIQPSAPASPLPGDAGRSPWPAPVAAPLAPRLPADRIWIDSERLLAIDATGAALGFEPPPGITDGGGGSRLLAYIDRPGATPLGLGYDEAAAAWQLVDPATGATLGLPVVGNTSPLGLAGHDPQRILFEILDDDRSRFAPELALADLERDEVTTFGAVDFQDRQGVLLAWRDPYAYLFSFDSPGDPAAAVRLWQTDLRQLPLVPTELFALDPEALMETDPANGLLLVRRAGADHATLLDLATGAAQELPIPVVSGGRPPQPLGIFSPDGSLIAFARDLGGGARDLAVYERATGTVRVLLERLPFEEAADVIWADDGESLLALPRGDLGRRGQFSLRDLPVTQLRLDGRGGARSLELHGVTEVAPLGDEHLLVMRRGWLEAPALDGGPPLFAPVPVQRFSPIYQPIVHIP